MAYPDFVAAGAEVFGVSPDSAETLKKYAAAKETPFGFVSDTDRAVSKLFQTGKPGRQTRVTYVVGRGGTIAAAMHHEILIPKHISSALNTVKSLG